MSDPPDIAEWRASHERRVSQVEITLGRGPGPTPDEKGHGVLGALAEIFRVMGELRSDFAADRKARTEEEARRDLARSTAEKERREWWANVAKWTAIVIAAVTAIATGTLWILSHVSVAR